MTIPSPSKHFVSTLIPLSETVSWRIHNVSELLKNSSFSAMSLPLLEVGWGPTGLSKWEISLHSNITTDILQARARLIELLPSSLKQSRVKRNDSYSQVKYGNEFQKCKDICIGAGGPCSSYWKILPLEDLRDVECGILNLDEDCLDLIIKLDVFGQDVSSQESCQE